MGTQTIQIPPAVHAALQRGEVIEAIRLLRDSSGLDLRGAKEAVDALQRIGGITSMEIERGEQRAGATGDLRLPPEVVAALSQGNVIEAIKRLRSLQPMTLRDARAMVERHRPAAAMPRYSPTVAPGDRGGRLWWWVLLALIAIAGWAWWSGRG